MLRCSNLNQIIRDKCVEVPIWIKWFLIRDLSGVLRNMNHFATFTFSHFVEAFIQSDLQLGNTWSDWSWRGKQTEEVPLTPSLRHSSNKYKLAREGEKDKEKSVLFFILCFILFRMGVGRSFHQPGMVKENVLERDLKSLCDGTTSRRSLAPQTSGGDVDS